MKQMSLQLMRNADELRRLMNAGAGNKRGRQPDFRLMIRLIDPILVARRESRAARLISDFARDFVIHEVYKTVGRDISTALAERKIDAGVEIVIV